MKKAQKVHFSDIGADDPGGGATSNKTDLQLVAGNSQGAIVS